MFGSATIDRRYQANSLSSEVTYWQLFIGGIGILAVASFYCLLHGFEYEPFRFDLSVTLGWAVPRWGAWPFLLPLCYGIFRMAHARGVPVFGVVMAGLATMIGVTVFAYLSGFVVGTPGTVFQVAYHIAPGALATFVILTAAGFILSRSTHPVAGQQTNDVQDDSSLMLEVWRGTVPLTVAVKDIERIKAAKNYVELYSNGKCFIRRSSMAELEQLLPTDEFMRVHRSFIVQKVHVVRIRGGRTRPSLVMTSGISVPVGRSYRDRVFRFCHAINAGR